MQRPRGFKAFDNMEANKNTRQMTIMFRLEESVESTPRGLFVPCP